MNRISSATAEITGVDRPRRLLVLRHGQTSHNASGIWQGQTDTDLSEVGREQAAVAAHALAGQGIDVIVTSDLRRAADTATTVAAELGLPVRTDARFREINVGEWAGRTVAEVAAEFPQDMERMRTGEDFRRGGTGESLADVAARVRPAAQEVLDTLPAGGTALVVAHGVSGRAVAAELAGIDARTAWLALGSLENCHWAEVGERPGGWRIERWNVGA